MSNTIISDAKAFNDLNLNDHYESFSSRPLDKINIPEIINFQAKFQYNYFEKGERERKADINLVNIDMYESDNVIFYAGIKQRPRGAILTWKAPSIQETNLDSSFTNETLPSSTITIGQNNFSEILTEGAISNNVFAGFELVDTGREEKIYTMLKASESIINLSTITAKDSRKTAAQKLSDEITRSGGLFGADKKLIVEAFAGIKNQNISILQKELYDNYNSTSLSDNDPLTKQTFSIQANKLLLNDIVKSSTLRPDNIYQDELRGLLEISQNIKNDLLQKIDPNGFNELDYDLQVSAINAQPVENLSQLSGYPQVLFAGYLIEKYRLLKDQTMKLVGRRVINNIKQTNIVDHGVTYGEKYFYKIRTLCQVKTVVSSNNLDDPACNQVMIATIIVASEGKSRSIICAENIAPNPPISMRATFNFKTLKPRITWQFPINKQRDIKRFQIFKRLSISDPFTLIAEYDFDDSNIRTPLSEIASSNNIYYMQQPRLSFTDNSHKEGEKPIYTVACVDAHGLSSNYGPQIQVERDKYTNKVLRKVISGPNAPKPYPNLLINQDSFLDAIKVSRYKKIKLFFDPEYYKVTKYRSNVDTSKTQEEIYDIYGQEEGAIFEDDLNFLMIDPDKFTYKMQLINIDNQKDQIIKIKLTDKSSPPEGREVLQSAANISQNNLSFQYGIS